MNAESVGAGAKPPVGDQAVADAVGNGGLGAKTGGAAADGSVAATDGKAAATASSSVAHATGPAKLDASMSLARPAERATAARLSADGAFTGRTFKGVPPPDPGYDWIDDLGRTYDALGDGTKSQYLKVDDFTDSIKHHLLKGNDFRSST